MPLAQPKHTVSVCIPAYNGATYIGEAIQSVLDQTFTDFELIVVDDCSEDNTESVVKSFRDSRLRYFSNPKRYGLVGNWNRCLELATGEYISIFHQDDLMLPHNLVAKIGLLEQNAKVGLVYSNLEQIDHEGNHIPLQIASRDDLDSVQPGLKFFESLMLEGNHVCCPSVVVRRSCYEQVSGFDSRLPFTADWEMWMRIGLFYDVAYLSAPLIKYRWHSASETHRYLHTIRELKQHFLAKRLVLEKYPDRIPNQKSLAASVTDDMGKRAFDFAGRHYFHKRYREAKQYLMFALKLKPALLWNARVNRLAAKLLLGEHGTEAVINAKRRLANSRPV